MTASYRYHGGSPQRCARNNPPMLTLDALDTRLSIPTRQLSTPGPDAVQLQHILRTAVRVPDHGKRVPFRFLRITGPARASLAVAAAERLREREPEAGEAVIDKLRTRFLMPPLTIAVVAKLLSAVYALVLALAIFTLLPELSSSLTTWVNTIWASCMLNAP